MLFALTHRNTPYTIFVYPIILIALWISQILNLNDVPMYYDSYPMPFYAWSVQLQAYSIYACYGVTLFFILANALLISRIQVLFRIIDTATLTPILLYFLLSASCGVFQQCSPLHPALTFLLLSVISIFKMYKNEQGLQPAFEAGFMLAMGSMLYANLIFFSVFLYISLLILVPFNWRQWISLSIGIFTPLFIISSAYFLFDQFQEFIDVFIENTIVWRKPFLFDYEHLIFFGLVALIAIRALLYAFSGSIKKVATKKYYSLFFVFILVTALTFFLVPTAGKEVFFFLIFPLIFILGNYLENMRSRFWQELLFTLIVAGVISIQVLA